MSGFSFSGKPVSDDWLCPNIFAFCAFMSAAVANRRGGRPSQYVRECADFMADVIGNRLSIRDPLPADYDWRIIAAKESADALMEYDS